MNKTRYSATEFGGNKPMNFRLSGTLKHSINQVCTFGVKNTIENDEQDAPFTQNANVIRIRKKNDAKLLTVTQ